EGSDPRSATDTEPSQSRQPTPPANATEPSPAPTPKVAAAKVATSEADTPKQTSLPKKPERDRENVDSPPVTSDSPAPRKPPDREAILSLGEDSYVVQLLASKRERDATRLLDRWNLRDRAFHIRGTHKGATLYLVLSYPVTGFSEARKVLQALPEELRDKGAWIRGADGIKRMVR
ncbi:MAG: SPOR domain-containing protein, partial [Gammaproteobacteria bacterium]